MIYGIESGRLSAEINSLGAELFSLKSRSEGIEYLWQGDARYWSGRSTVLFPICGRLYGGKYTYREREYEMPIHGIAKLFDFTPERHSASEISFTLTSSEQTREYYPFDFEFTVRYTLTEECLRVGFFIKNTGSSQMYFSYGAHPGFAVPFASGECFSDYYLEFDKDELSQILFSDTCFRIGKGEKFSLDKKRLRLSHSLFDNDAIFFESEGGRVKLASDRSPRAIEVEYENMTSLGIWHKPHTDAPYICIEPWHGTPSLDGVVDDFEKKSDMIRLCVGEEYSSFYTIKITDG